MAINVAQAPIQGQKMYLEISTDNGVTWKKLACLTKQGINKERQINDTETQCGIFRGVGALKVDIPLEGAVNEIPPTEMNLISYKELDTLIEDAVAVMVRQIYDTATEPYSAVYNAYLNQINLDVPVNNIATFSGNLSCWK